MPEPRWRVGTKVPLHVYEQLGDEPDTSAWPDGDRPVGVFHRPVDAALAVEAVNRALSPTRGQPLNAVSATLFTDTGKYKYVVTLDYTDEPPGWRMPGERAAAALRRATERDTSGVTLKTVPTGWYLVVIDPPEGFPVMVHG